MRETDLETYLGTDAKLRAGRFATLLTLLPANLELDTRAPLPDQIARVARQVNAEMLAFLRMLACDAPPSMPGNAGTATCGPAAVIRCTRSDIGALRRRPIRARVAHVVHPDGA
jgi:hypothetical protein